jgi:hypothetical protein
MRSENTHPVAHPFRGEAFLDGEVFYREKTRYTSNAGSSETLDLPYIFGAAGFRDGQESSVR